MLAFSRKQPPALRVADLNQVIARIANTLPRLMREDLEFRFKRGEGLGPVRVDPLQVEQVLINLGANARDAMPQGGHLRIETSDARLDGDYIHNKQAVIPLGRDAQISVSDDGPEFLPSTCHTFSNPSTPRNRKDRAPD